MATSLRKKWKSPRLRKGDNCTERRYCTMKARVGARARLEMLMQRLVVVYSKV